MSAGRGDGGTGSDGGEAGLAMRTGTLRCDADAADPRGGGIVIPAELFAALLRDIRTLLPGQ